MKDRLESLILAASTPLITRSIADPDQPIHVVLTVPHAAPPLEDGFLRLMSQALGLPLHLVRALDARERDAGADVLAQQIALTLGATYGLNVELRLVRLPRLVCDANRDGERAPNARHIGALMPLSLWEVAQTAHGAAWRIYQDFPATALVVDVHSMAARTPKHPVPLERGTEEAYLASWGTGALRPVDIITSDAGDAFASRALVCQLALRCPVLWALDEPYSIPQPWLYGSSRVIRAPGGGGVVDVPRHYLQTELEVQRISRWMAEAIASVVTVRARETPPDLPCFPLVADDCGLWHDGP